MDWTTLLREGAILAVVAGAMALVYRQAGRRRQARNSASRSGTRSGKTPDGAVPQYTRDRAWMKQAPGSVGVERWAQKHGWTYNERDDAQHYYLLSSFVSGSNRRSLDVLGGNYRGIQATSWTFRTVPAERKLASDTHVLALALPAKVPHLQLQTVKPRFAWVALGRRIWTGDEAFDHAWYVRGRKKKHAQELLSPYLRSHLMRLDLWGDGFAFEQDRLITWRAGRQQPQYIDEGLEQLHELLTILPTHLWHPTQQY